MPDALVKLISIGSGALLPQPSGGGALAGHAFSEDLAGLLRKKNGFYAFESALHVLPAGSGGAGRDLEQWNSDDLWRSAYGGLAEGCLFFAEDVFGGQFCFYEGEICTFDPETGAKEGLGKNLEEWAAAILADYEFLTGYPFARDWQAAHGRLPVGKRLVPKQPFVLQGEYTLANLYLLDAVKGMRLRGELATQIRDLPEGAKVRYEVTE